MTVVHCHGLCQKKKKQATGIPDNVSCIRGRRLRQLWVGKYQGKQNLACSMNLEGLLDQKRPHAISASFSCFNFLLHPERAPRPRYRISFYFVLFVFASCFFFPGYHHPRVICSVQRRANPPQKKSPSRRASAVWVDAQGTHTLSASFSLFLALSLSRSIFLPGNHPANRKPGTPPNYDVQENTTSYRMFVTHFFFWAALPRLVLVGHVRKHPRRPRYPVDTFFFFLWRRSLLALKHPGLVSSFIL